MPHSRRPGSTRRPRRLGLTVAAMVAVAGTVLAVRGHAPPHDASSPHGGAALPTLTAPGTPSPGLGTIASRLAALKASTAVSCSPIHRYQALVYGVGPFCVPWDWIPAVDHPRFTAASKADFLHPEDPVIALDLGSVHRAYPVVSLETHEIVNDVVQGLPVAVTFCPLCNSGVGFSRRVGSRTLDFGVSGELAEANLIMFDRQTLSTWQQLTGAAISGPLRGTHLPLLPVQMLSFATWRAAHPDGHVMLEPRGASLDYTVDAYSWYDKGPRVGSPFLRNADAPGTYEPTDPRLPPKWRVIGAITAHGSVAFPTPRHPGEGAVELFSVRGIRLVALFRYGLAQPERAYTFAQAPRGWSGSVWAATLDGRRLSFRPQGDGFLETSTGSMFDPTGRGVSGPLAGRQLGSVPQVTAFWFAWSHFHPKAALAPFPGGA